MNRILLVSCTLLLPFAYAHGHDDEPTDEAASAPIDRILWLHMLLQTFVWGVLFPLGMAFGLSRSRWHVPVQTAGMLLTIGGIILGHSHGGRQFPPSAHGMMANIILLPLAVQAGLGVYLKMHIHERTWRPYVVTMHGIVGKSYPIWGWVQMLFGAIVFRGFCRGGHINQCLAHYIMGSGFIGYGIIMAIMFVAGEAWVRRYGRSPEFYDSAVITVWGVVNTFTEHWGGNWSVKDMQHTVMGGIMWWCGGLLGLFLSRNGQRSVVPSLIIILTGWAMGQHAQELMFSTKVHGTFGQTLMLAGLCRILEIVFFAPSVHHFSSSTTSAVNESYSSENAGAIALPPTPATPGIRHSAAPAPVQDDFRAAGGRAFRHLPPFLMIAAGLLFMSATDEELRTTHSAGMDHVTYILIFFSLAFLIYALALSLVHIATATGKYAPDAADVGGPIELSEAGSGLAWKNGGYARVPDAPNHSRADGRSSQQHVIGADEEED